MWTSSSSGANALAVKTVGTGVGVEVGEGVEDGVDDGGVEDGVEDEDGEEEVGAAAAKNGMSERIAPVTFIFDERFEV